MSIRSILFLNMAVLLLLVLGSGYILMSRQMTHDIESISRQQLDLLADTIRLHILDLIEAGATMAILDSTFATLRQRHQEILVMRFLHGEAVNRQFGVHEHEQPGDQIEIDGLAGDQPMVVRSQENNRDVVRFVFPLDAEQQCLTCHEAVVGERLGALSLTLDIGPLATRLKEGKQGILIIYLAEIVLIFLILTYLLHHLVFRRLHELHRAADHLARGDFTTPVAGESNNETGILVRAFNHMARQIKILNEEQDEKIREQANELSFLLEMSENISSSQAITEILHQFARIVAESIKVTCCRIALLDEEKQILTIKANYPLRYLPKVTDEEVTYSKIDCPNIWRVIESQHQCELHDGEQISDCEREMLLFDKAKSVLCIPIIGKKVIGVVALIEFRTEEREPITEEKIRCCWALIRQLAAGIENGYLRERLIEHTKESILAMAETVDKKSHWTAGHSDRVTVFAIAIGKEIGMDENQLNDLRTAGLLHDIGKIGTPGAILDKPGKLTQEEREIINHHPEDGAQILSKMRQFTSVLPAIRHHHESYDGKGYPDGLKGEDTPFAARVLAVADAYDAMTSDRPYRKGFTRDAALSVLQKEKGRQFDPQVVEAFLRYMESSSGNS